VPVAAHQWGRGQERIEIDIEENRLQDLSDRQRPSCLRHFESVAGCWSYSVQHTKERFGHAPRDLAWVGRELVRVGTSQKQLLWPVRRLELLSEHLEHYNNIMLEKVIC